MDKTFWRRFSQKILIGLPDKKLMPLLLKHKLSNFTTLLSDAQYEELAEKWMVTHLEISIILSITLLQKKQMKNTTKDFIKNLNLIQEILYLVNLTHLEACNYQLMS